MSDFTSASKRLESENTLLALPMQQASEPPALLADLGEDYQPWDAHKAHGDAVAALLAEAPERDFGRYGSRVKNCAELLMFHRAAEGAAPGWRFDGAYFCHFRHCPICQWRRSMQWKARFFRAIPQIIEAHPSARWLTLTLTVRNPEVTRLRSTLKMMNLGWARLVKRDAFAPVLGWVRSTEVTRKKDDGTAHPHFHVLLMVRPSYFGVGYLSHARWVELWQGAAGLNYEPNVHITVVKPRRGEVAETPVDLLRGAVAETLKYSTKAADLVADAEWLVEMTKQVRGLRFMAAGGLLKDVLKDPRRNADQETTLDVEQVEDVEPRRAAVYGWKRASQRYRRNRLESCLADLNAEAQSEWRREQLEKKRAAAANARAALARVRARLAAQIQPPMPLFSAATETTVAEKKSASAFGGTGASVGGVSEAAPPLAE